MICLWASVSSSDQWGQLVPGCGACIVSTVDVSVLFSRAPRAVGGKSCCPGYLGRRGQQKWAGVLMSPHDPGLHRLCSGLGTAALCIWREAILPGAPGHQRGFLAKGGPCTHHLSLSSNLISSLLIVSEPPAWCPGWTGLWAPLVARRGLALQGLGPRPQGIQMPSDPTLGISAGMWLAPRARGGWHPALGSREASWRR